VRHTHPSRSRVHTGRTKICPGCKEPERVFEPVQIGTQTIEVCTSCATRIREKAKGIAAERTRKPDQDVREVMRNSRGDKRRGDENIGYGADSPLDAEPID